MQKVVGSNPIIRSSKPLNTGVSRFLQASSGVSVRRVVSLQAGKGAPDIDVENARRVLSLWVSPVIAERGNAASGTAL